jgi:hypothetical protein
MAAARRRCARFLRCSARQRSRGGPARRGAARATGGRARLARARLAWAASIKPGWQRQGAWAQEQLLQEGRASAGRRRASLLLRAAAAAGARRQQRGSGSVHARSRKKQAHKSSVSELSVVSAPHVTEHKTE